MVLERRLYLGLAGLAGSGKDEVAKHLIEHHGFSKVAFADPVREAVLALDPIVYIPGEFLSDEVKLWGDYLLYSTVIEWLGYEKAKKIPDVRRYLQRMGTEVGRQVFGQDFWVDLAMKRADDIGGRVVFTDTRFANEVAAILDRDGYIIYVHRPGVTAPNDHASEAYAKACANDAGLYDYRIDNDGTLEELTAKVDALMGEITDDDL